MISTGKRLYLDYNASAPLLDEARDAVIAALDILGNPSSVHKEGGQRAHLLKLQGAMSLLWLMPTQRMCSLPPAQRRALLRFLTPNYMMGRAPVRMSHLYIGATEHPCVLAGGQFPAENISLIPVSSDGLLHLDQLQSALTAHDKTSGLPLVAVQAANNETGVLQPIEEIASVVKAAGGVLVVDAVQAAGRINIDITNNYADYLIVSSHKIGGPKGVGAVIAVSDLMMPRALVRGGGQEKGHRAGTEALPLIAGFGAAACCAATRLKNGGWAPEMRDRLETGILEIAPEATIYGKSVLRIPNTTFFSLQEQKAETVQIAFDLAGIALSAGSACSSGKVGPSHVLEAMGFKNGPGAIRVSLSPDVSSENVDQFLKAFAQIVSRHQRSKSRLSRK